LGEVLWECAAHWSMRDLTAVWTPPRASSHGLSGHSRLQHSVPRSSAPPGLEEALYREAELRRLRQARREQEAWAHAKQQTRPRLSDASRLLCQGRLEREVREAFLEHCRLLTKGKEVASAPLSVPRDRLGCVLESMGLFGTAGRDDALCSQLAFLLDQEESGEVTFVRLQSFLLRTLDRGGPDMRLWPQQSTLEEDCLRQLEKRLARCFGRLLSNRLSRPRGEQLRRATGTAVPSAASPRREARSASPSACRSVSNTQTAAPHNVVPVSTACTRRIPADPCMASGAGRSSPSTPRRVRPDRPRSATRSCRPEESQQVSRCLLLYHQGVFASKEMAQLEEDVRALKKQEEMRECTFQPQLLPRTNCSATPPQPRNFDVAIARMRSANDRRAKQHQERNHVPCGENYEKLRRLGAKPFSWDSEDKHCTGAAVRQAPMMYVDVNVGRGRTGRIGVREGDDLQVLSRNFAKVWSLDGETVLKLEEILHQAIHQHMHCEWPQGNEGWGLCEEEETGSSASSFAQHPQDCDEDYRGPWQAKDGVLTEDASALSEPRIAPVGSPPLSAASD